MVHIKKGKVFIEVEGEVKETTNPELIGLAMLDLAEINKKERNRIDFVTRDHKKLIGLIDAKVENELLHNYLYKELDNLGICVGGYEVDFNHNSASTYLLVNFFEMIKSKKLILNPIQDEVAK